MKREQGLRPLDLMVLFAAIFALPAIVMLLQPRPISHRDEARQLKDSVQVRAIHQAMVAWALQNHEEPSADPPEAPAVGAPPRSEATPRPK